MHSWSECEMFLIAAFLLGGKGQWPVLGDITVFHIPKSSLKLHDCILFIDPPKHSVDQAFSKLTGNF